VDDVQFAHQQAVYSEFARLYRIARRIRPSAVDRWSGKLSAYDGGPCGGLDSATGSMRLSRELVLDHLTGSTTRPPSSEQAQALAVVLHAAYDARVALDAPGDPAAVRTADSLALHEGLVGRQTVTDFDLFAELSAYGDLLLDGQSREGAVEAADRLVAYAAGPASRDELVTAALDRPLTTHWVPIADTIVRRRLDGVVPLEHREAARHAVIDAMTAGWAGLQYRSRAAGELVARSTETAVESTLAGIRDHYQRHPAVPYGADPATRAAFTAQAPAAWATRSATPADTSHRTNPDRRPGTELCL
jgi:hypothetical protein